MTIAFVDCLLIVLGVFTGELLRFGEAYRYFFIDDYSIWKVVAFVLAIQIPFYYFDLYKLIYLREKKKILFLLSKSMGISLLLLAILSYAVPSLAIGRGILVLSLMVIFALTFFSRFTFAYLCRNIIRERILIVGVGDLSLSIVKDINENGRDSFEIIGFVEE